MSFVEQLVLKIVSKNKNSYQQKRNNMQLGTADFAFGAATW